MIVAVAGLVLLYAPGLSGRRPWGTYADHFTEQVFSGCALGTTYTVKVLRKGGVAAHDRRDEIEQAIANELKSINDRMSVYSPDSELSQFNRFQSTEPFPVSPELAQLIALALEVSNASGGAFDITVAPLIEAWGFGPGKRRERPPSEDEIIALKNRVGSDKIEVDLTASTLRKTQSDVACDLGGIAQGYASDRVASILETLGYAHYMVEVGGEVKTAGHNVRGGPWQIAIEKPITTGRDIQIVIPLTDLALSTSGDYRNYYEQDGVRLSHTIDPQSGRPIAHKLASVSVVHDGCAVADAWATALMVLGPEKGYDMAVKHNLAAYFIIHTVGDSFTDQSTPAFQALLGSTSAVE